MKIFFILILMGMAEASDFPVMADSVQIIDRAIVRCATPGEEHTLYIVLYNLEGSGTIEIFSGVRLLPGWHWESVCFWQPKNTEGDPVLFDRQSVLSVRQENASVIITWIDDLDIPQGSAAISLDYNLQYQGYEEFPTY